jgi:hypothetical protein
VTMDRYKTVQLECDARLKEWDCLFAAQDAKEERDFQLSRQRANKLDGHPSTLKSKQHESVTPQGETSSSSGINRGQDEVEDEEFVFTIPEEEEIVYETNLDLLADIDFSVVPKGETPERKAFRIQRLAQHLLTEQEVSASSVVAEATAKKRPRRKPRMRLTGNQRDKQKGKGRYAASTSVGVSEREAKRLGWTLILPKAEGQPLGGIVENEKWVWAPSLGTWVIE